MRRNVGALALSLVLGITAVPMHIGMAEAGAVQNACLQSGRSAAGRALCTCIQHAADATLSRREQRMAARFFRDPQRAQDVRMSSRSSDNAFWARYRQFGDLAAARCSAAG